ncbi:hypothetical protein C1646_660577 [Rhizophagus diaphanus]|nr:hypothetical protein C1646_660577 [Rhizophagus diaphanus] [Rhizophagus sp. MUCL 43196]
MLTLTRILVPVFYMDKRTGRIFRILGAAWWFVFEELSTITSVPALILPTPENPYAAWLDLFRRVSQFFFYYSFIFFLTILLIPFVIYRAAIFLITQVILLLNFLLAFLPVRPAPNPPQYITVINRRVELGQVRQFSTSAIFFYLSSHVPEIGIKSLVEKEIISPISGVGRKTIEELAKENLGFSPFLTKEQLAKLEAEWETEKNQDSEIENIPEIGDTS